MSANGHDSNHEEAHTGPIKTPKQVLLASLFAFVVPIFIIIGLVYYVTSENKPQSGSVNVEKAVAERIQKVGFVEIRDANRPLRAGEEVYKAQCSACHAAGAAGAPKFQDAAAWGPRIATGYEALLNSALKGKNAMGPPGWRRLLGCGNRPGRGLSGQCRRRQVCRTQGASRRSRCGRRGSIRSCRCQVSTATVKLFTSPEIARSHGF